MFFFFIVAFYVFNLYRIYLLNRLQYLAFDKFLTPGINLPVSLKATRVFSELGSHSGLSLVRGFLAALSKVFRKE